MQIDYKSCRIVCNVVQQSGFYIASAQVTRLHGGESGAVRYEMGMLGRFLSAAEALTTARHRATAWVDRNWAEEAMLQD